MKKNYALILFSWLLIFFSALGGKGIGGEAFAQAPPQGINYQAVARDASGNPIASQTITVTLRVRQGSATGTPVYRGTQTVTTNQFGLFTAIIGKTASDSASFSTIPWGTNKYYLQVVVSGNDMGATQLLTVPYAFHSYTADSVVGGGGNFPWTKSGNVVSLTNPNDSIRIGAPGPPPYNAKLFLTGSMRMINDTLFFSHNDNVNIFGSTSEFITFTTNGFERMRVDNVGNVGIGKNNPTANLHVVGSYTASASANIIAEFEGVQSAANSLSFYGVSAQPGFTAVTGNTLNILYGITSTPVNINTGTITNAHGLFSRVDNNSTGKITNLYGLYVASPFNNGTITNKYAIVTEAGAGNVGIGTNTPGTKLEVAGQVKITGGSPAIGAVLTSDASGLAAWQTPALSNMQAFTSNGTFTIPSGVTKIMVEVWGGGGGGAGCNASNQTNGGGGGGYGKIIFGAVIPSTLCSFTIGVGGAGGNSSGSSGANGGTTAFTCSTYTISASGGTGGSGTTVVVGVGGTCTTPGAFTMNGGSGCYGGTNFISYGGMGANGGAGGLGGIPSTPAPTGIAPGGGGGGAYSGSPASSGGSGGAGRVVVWW